MNIQLAPSLISTDLCNLEQGAVELSKLAIDMLHIDIIDGYFSPSMPLGLDTVRSLRKKTELPFDFHLMAKENDFFINEIIDIGAKQICFHYETELHVDRLINRIKKAGSRAGIALVPSTPISVLEYVIEKCDFVLLMLINPGFAGDKSEKQVPYARRKVEDCHNLIKRRGLDTSIEIDGRVATNTIADFIAAGSDILVLGSQSLFSVVAQPFENLKQIKIEVASGIERRMANEIS